MQKKRTIFGDASNTYPNNTKSTNDPHKPDSVKSEKELRSEKRSDLKSKIDKGELEAPIIERLPLDKSSERLENIIFIQNTPQKKYESYLSSMKELAIAFVRVYHNHLDENPLVCRILTLSNVQNSGTYRKNGKVGQTRRTFLDRLAEQTSIDKAGILSTSSEITSLMELPQFVGFLAKAIAMKPPALQHYEGNESKVCLIIFHMFVEMAQASCHKGTHGKVFEDMMWTPSLEIEVLVTPPDVFNPDAGRVLRSTKFFQPLFSWCHACAQLQDDRDDLSLPDETRAMLNQSLRENNKDRFAKWNFLLRSYAYSDKLLPFVDAVSGIDNPRVQELTQIAEEIEKIFTSEIMEEFISNGSLPKGLDIDVRKVLGKIDKQSDNYNGYKAPSDKELLSGYMNQLQVLRRNKYDCGMDEVCIVTEMTFLKLLKEDDAKNNDTSNYDTVFPPRSTFHEQKDRMGNVVTIVVETPKGQPNFQFIYSYFRIVSPSTRAVIRINTVRRWIATMALNKFAGIVSNNDFESDLMDQCPNQLAIIIMLLDV
jgi:hypothetical protein